MHERQAIREAVVAALKNAAGVAAIVGARVYPNRTELLRRPELPAIVVFTLAERVDESSAQTAPRELERILTLAIECAVEEPLEAEPGGKSVDDQLDDLAREVEKAMDADDTFGATAADSILTQTDVDLLEEGERRLGVMRLSYDLTYYTKAPREADETLDDFTKGTAEFNLGGEQHENNRANDEFAPEQ